MHYILEYYICINADINSDNIIVYWEVVDLVEGVMVGTTVPAGPHAAFHPETRTGIHESQSAPAGSIEHVVKHSIPAPPKYAETHALHAEDT